ncbi:MAG: porin [Gammaproteobacteria bacterium]|nr:porin [Gammaproteobacteria bacterium]
MRTYRVWSGLLLLIAATPAVSQTPSVDEIWAIVQQQQAEIAELKARLAEADVQLASADQKIEATGDYLETMAMPAAAPKTKIGGYGELHYNNLDADDSTRDVDQIDYHRFVLFFGHEFSDRVNFFSEVELEHSLAGDGAPGEVELEQAYVDFALSDTLNAKTGLFILPLGFLNETHEPPTFYGVERNSIENVIIPTTWWEAGAALSGRNERGFSWDLALHSGLAIPTEGSSAFRVRSGRQKVAEAIASDPAYTARMRYSGMPGLDLAASFQYQADASQQSGDGLDAGKLFVFNANYDIGAFSLRGLYASWDFDGAAVEAAGADSQSGWYLEPSYQFASIVGDWGIYTRYEDVEGARSQDQFTQLEIGASYWPVDNVVLKLDYRQRDHDLSSESGRDFDGFDLGVGYQF